LSEGSAVKGKRQNQDEDQKEEGPSQDGHQYDGCGEERQNRTGWTTIDLDRIRKRPRLI